MGFFSKFFQPAWMSENPKRALKAVEETSNQARLYEIAKHAPLGGIREKAADKLINQNDLIAIAKNDNDRSSLVRCRAIGKLTDQDVLADIAKNNEDDNVRCCAIRKLADQDLLLFIALHDKNESICLAALANLTDQAAIAKVAMRDDFLVFNSAVLNLNDEVLLRKVHAYRVKSLHGHIDSHDLKEALAMFDDNNVLADIARGARSSVIATAAVSKISDQCIIADIALSAGESVSLQAISKLTIQNALADIIKRRRESKVASAAIARLIDQNLLIGLLEEQDLRGWERFEIAEKITDQVRVQEIYASIAGDRQESGWLRLKAAEKLNDKTLAQHIYADIAQNDDDWSNRSRALDELADQRILASIAKSSSGHFKYERNIEFGSMEYALRADHDTRWDSVSCMTDPDLLADVAENAADEEVRSKAKEKLKKLSGRKGVI